jgi:hypothetical protein
MINGFDGSREACAAGPQETITTERIDPGQGKGIDKSVLAIPAR